MQHAACRNPRSRAQFPSPHAATLCRRYEVLLRDLAADTVLGDIAAWIAEPAAPLPSGHERATGPPRGGG